MIVKRGISGLGLFAAVDFARADLIVEYTGEYVDQTEADRRGGKYLFTVTDNCFIDGKSRSNIARYINHSCRPNAYAEADEEDQTIRIYAKKRIKSGEEILYHYGQEYWQQHIGSNCKCARCQSSPTR